MEGVGTGGPGEECVRYSHKFGVELEWDVTGKGVATGGFVLVFIYNHRV